MESKQPSFHDILNTNYTQKLPSELPGQHILDDVILNVNPKSEINNIIQNNLSEIQKNNIKTDTITECPFSHKKGTVSGCPFMNSQSTDLKVSKFDYHFEIPFPENVQDFRFNKLNYSKEDIPKSEFLRKLPRHLRNTIFINNKRIEEIRNKEFPVIFIICEEMKEKGYNFYENQKYTEALRVFNLIYSIFKWVSIKDPIKKDNFLNKYDFEKENSLLDSDIEIRRINTNKQNEYEESGFKSYVINILKCIAYCHMKMRHYSEAVKCMDEAMSYVLISRGEVLFRRAQAVMYNKFSKLNELHQAHMDLNQAKILKKIELIDEHLNDIEKLINEKSYRNIANIKNLIKQTNYAFNIIQTKNLNVKDHIYASYDDIFFGAKIVEEMRTTFFSTVKFYQEKLIGVEEKNFKEFEEFLVDYDKFFDFYGEYCFYMNLQIFNLDKDTLAKLDDNDRVTIKKMKTNETMNILFKDFRLKKAQEIYDDMDWNMTIWKHCFGIVNEREKKLKEERRLKQKENEPPFLKKLIQNPLSNTQHAIFTFMFVFVTLLSIGLYAMYFSDNTANFKSEK